MLRNVMLCFASLLMTAATLAKTFDLGGIRPARLYTPLNLQRIQVLSSCRHAARRAQFGRANGPLAGPDTCERSPAIPFAHAQWSTGFPGQALLERYD